MPPVNPDPAVEIVELSAEELLDTRRFQCKICLRKFHRDLNLEMHYRTHNLEANLHPKGNKEKLKKLYLCPEVTCVHHSPSKALKDFAAVKKHFLRKHQDEKNWKCPRCAKAYAVNADMKAHLKTCGTKVYNCSFCAKTFLRREEFNYHRRYCNPFRTRFSPNLQNPASTLGMWTSMPQPFMVPPVNMWSFLPPPPVQPVNILPFQPPPTALPVNMCTPPLPPIAQPVNMFTPPLPTVEKPVNMCTPPLPTVEQPGNMCTPPEPTVEQPVMFTIPARFGLGPEDL